MGLEVLAVYDTTGRIIYQGAGDVYEPAGIPSIRVTVPNGKRLVSINTSKESHEPVFADIMGIDPVTATLEQLKVYLGEKNEKALADYLEAHPITSSAHGATEKLYTITKDKQTFLTQMILITQVAINSGVEYQPSWNAQGEPCTYDWTIAELQQLAFEIESVVRPLVSHQQTIDAQIRASATKEEALAVTIEY